VVQTVSTLIALPSVSFGSGGEIPVTLDKILSASELAAWKKAGRPTSSRMRPAAGVPVL